MKPKNYAVRWQLCRHIEEELQRWKLNPANGNPGLCVNQATQYAIEEEATYQADSMTWHGVPVRVTNQLDDYVIIDLEKNLIAMKEIIEQMGIKSVSEFFNDDACGV